MRAGSPPPPWFPTDEAVVMIPFDLLRRLLDLRTESVAQGLFLEHWEFTELHGQCLRRMQHYLKCLPEIVQPPTDRVPPVESQEPIAESATEAAQELGQHAEGA